MWIILDLFSTCYACNNYPNVTECTMRIYYVSWWCARPKLYSYVTSL